MDFLESQRLRMVSPWLRGRVCDIGCGYNNLLRNYRGPGVGVDVYPWPGTEVLIPDASCLPFRDETFDTVTVVAALNHFPRRLAALQEIRRILKPMGHVIFTMIGPLTGVFAHVLFRQDEAKRGGLCPGEKDGLTQREIYDLLKTSGLQLIKRIPFQLGLNAVYLVAKQESLIAGDAPKAKPLRA